jgi:D-lactate dehydrogenase
MNDNFLINIQEILSTHQIINDITRRRAFGTDASFYQLIPKLILVIETENQMQSVISLANNCNVPITFRAAGTSLSGQAITDSVLIMLSTDWNGFEIEKDGLRIRLQPGIIGADANHHLLPYQRKLGPDPASINTCKIGGIAANNASGMCCGVSKNSYYSLADMTVILADGTIIDSRNKQSIDDFHNTHKPLLKDLDNLAKEVKSDSELSALIKHKYRLKNTTGYAINALVDFNEPLDILLHLMIGSEGTLGFISNITYNTVPDYKHKASALYSFSSAEQACLLVTALSSSPVEAVELMDQRAINSVKGKDGLPDRFCQLPDETTALLIETRAESAQELHNNIAVIEALIASYTPVEAINFTTDIKLCTQLWAIRKATFPAVGAVRETGTTVIIEDVSFPIDKLAEGIVRLHKLFEQFNYSEAIIFGHALAGNLHFVFTQSFDDEKEIQRYDQFMQQVANLVAVEFKGSLKAEHGTGRNMAPFVELEWGEKAYQVMKRLKGIIDPKNTLNPGVILNEDKQTHIKNLKLMPHADPIVDKCIECGFCEPVCPSKELSLTPRQRIVLWRRIQQLNDIKTLTQSEKNELNELKKNYQYLGIDSCAATGLCAERCPVGINTGNLIRKLRSEKLGNTGQLIAKWSASHFAGVSSTAAVAFKVNSIATKLLGDTAVDKIGAGLHNISGKHLPLWHSKWPTKATMPTIKEKKESEGTSDVALHGNNNGKPQRKQIIFFASCASRTMGPSTSSKDQRSLTDVSIAVFEKAGIDIIYPKAINELCCGLPFHSKGASDIAEQKGKQLIQRLSEISNNGQIPIVFDTSPCNLRIKELGTQLPIYELTDFCAQFVVDHLTITPKTTPVALHITCSSRKAGISESLRKIANTCATEVIEPLGIECCGFAGDKGFTMPELNQSALSSLKTQILDPKTKGYSNSRTCEIGLSKNSGIDYQSLIYLLDEVSV